MNDLRSIDTWCEQNHTAVFVSLNAGASTNDLENFKNYFQNYSKHLLPTQFVDLYTWHNGQTDLATHGLFFGWSFLSLETIVAEHGTAVDFLQSLDTDDGAKNLFDDLSADCESDPIGHIKCEYENQSWLPFASDGGGNFLAIDFDPDILGEVGQVISIGRDTLSKKVLAKDFEAFIEWFAYKLAKNEYVLQKAKDGSVVNFSPNPSDSFVF